MLAFFQFPFHMFLNKIKISDRYNLMSYEKGMQGSHLHIHRGQEGQYTSPGEAMLVGFAKVLATNKVMENNDIGTQDSETQKHHKHVDDWYHCVRIGPLGFL